MIENEKYDNPQWDSNIKLYPILGLYVGIDRGLVVGCNGKFIRIGWLFLEIGLYEHLDEYWEDKIK